VAATSTCAVAPASRAPATALPGRSSDFDGIHAKYEHSPPTDQLPLNDGDAQPAESQRRGTVLAGPPSAMTIMS